MLTGSEVVALRARITELEARLTFLYRHLGVEYVEDTHARDEPIIAMIQKGNLIEAIKIYRDLYQVNPAEAKKGVEELQRRLKR